MAIHARIDQGSMYRLHAKFEDSSGQTLVPRSVQFRVIDQYSGAVVRPWTELAGPFESDVQIELDLSDMNIIDTNRPYEVRRVVVVAEINESLKVKTHAYDIQVMNLGGIIPGVDSPGPALKMGAGKALRMRG